MIHMHLVLATHTNVSMSCSNICTKASSASKNDARIAAHTTFTTHRVLSKRFDFDFDAEDEDEAPTIVHLDLETHDDLGQ